jgi:hypothetical protein
MDSGRGDPRNEDQRVLPNNLESLIHVIQGALNYKYICIRTISGRGRRGGGSDAGNYVFVRQCVLFDGRHSIGRPETCIKQCGSLGRAQAVLLYAFGAFGRPWPPGRVSRKRDSGS